MTVITDVHNDLSQRLQPIEFGSRKLVYLMSKDVAVQLPNTLKKNQQRAHKLSSQLKLIPPLNGRRKMATVDDSLFFLIERFDTLVQRSQSDIYFKRRDVLIPCKPI